jgi:hypothetical protein
MDMLLITVALISLALAAGMSIVTWRSVRREHERSAARVAALAADIQGSATPALMFSGLGGSGSSATDADVPLSIDLASESEGGGGTLFGTAARSGSALGRLGPALLAGVVLVGGLVGSALLLAGGRDGGAAAARPVEPKALELLSLRHAVKQDVVTVTGLVRNPTGNVPLERVAAIVFLFDSKGDFIASGRAPLDFLSLGAGDESPFVVAVQAPAKVARYRVSFRRDEGGMLPHVDRREVR